MSAYLRTKLPFIILFIGIAAYILYFSLFGIMRYEKQYAHYFDLGIMHQTVYNTYRGMQTGDMSRILELTDPHEGYAQIKRMAVHNDVILLFLAPFYFIHDGPSTLLVIQTIVVALGAYFVFLITKEVWSKGRYTSYFALIFAYGYLLYPPLQKANNFDFHAVTLATTFLLAMFYFWLRKRYFTSFLFAVMSILTKEEIGLTVAFFGFYVLINSYSHIFTSVSSLKRFIHRFSLQALQKQFLRKEVRFGVILIVSGVVWVLFSLMVIIPYYRMGEHFGTKYFRYLILAPWKTILVIFRYESMQYLSILFSPLGFLSLFAPLQLFIALPGLAMNILADNENMRNIFFHYSSANTPFIFISAIYGAHTLVVTKFEILRKIADFIIDRFEVPKKGFRFIKPLVQHPEKTILFSLAGCMILSSLYLSPLPWGYHRDLYPWRNFPNSFQDVQLWKMFLKDETIKVSATGHLAPQFTSRRYFYNFAEGYDHAAYVVIDRYDITHGFQKDLKYAEYQKILRDFRYIKIYDKNTIEVFKRLKM